MSMRRPATKHSYLSTLCLGIFLIFLHSPGIVSEASAITLPPGFSETLVTNVSRPTALAFTPDGRLLITTQPGQLRVYRNGFLLGQPALDLTRNNRACSNGERGLLGLAVDPAFTVSRHIFLYYTFNRAGTCVNRVSRFTLSTTNIAHSEQVLIDNIPQPGGFHNAGDLHFGKDGYLYISVGDGGTDYAGDSGSAAENDASRDRHVLLGKILRITKTGAIPVSNPFRGTNSARCHLSGRTARGKVCQETFAWGLRNPFRMAFDPNADVTRFYINDVGQNHWEEINRGRVGADYGWNLREGPCRTGRYTNCGTKPASMINPIFAYRHSIGCSSVTGGAFAPRGAWPTFYDGAYLFSDYNCGKIFRLAPVSGGGFRAVSFATDLGNSSAVAMTFGRFGDRRALYYTSYANGGQVRAISFTGSENRAPIAAARANPRFGALPLSVNFDASASSDPDGDTLKYRWDFGDGSPSEFGRLARHVYRTAGKYLPTVRVSDDRGGVSTKTLRIDPGHTAPQINILSPAKGARYRVGQTITLTGKATDERNRVLPNNSLSWTVLLHHNDHTHPLVGPATGNNISFNAPPPEDLAATKTSYLEIRLTATDARGLARTSVQRLNPRLVDITFATIPTGLKLRVNGETITSRRILTSWENYRLNVEAPDQNAFGDRWTFRSWSDGGSRSHTITTPSSRQTFTARFN